MQRNDMRCTDIYCPVKGDRLVSDKVITNVIQWNKGTNGYVVRLFSVHLPLLGLNINITNETANAGKVILYNLYVPR